MQVYWSFDEAHPALAAEHCMRTKAQDDALHAAREAACLAANNARHEARTRLANAAGARRARSLSATFRASGRHSAVGAGADANRNAANTVPEPMAQPTAARRRRSRMATAASVDSAAQRVAAQQKRWESLEARASATLAHSQRLSQSTGGLCTLPLWQEAPAAEGTLQSRGPADSVGAPSPVGAEEVEQQDGSSAGLPCRTGSPEVQAADLAHAAHAPAAQVSAAAAAASKAEAAGSAMAQRRGGAEEQAALDQREDPVALGAFTPERYQEFETSLAEEMAARRAAGAAARDYASGVPSSGSARCCARGLAGSSLRPSALQPRCQRSCSVSNVLCKCCASSRWEAL